MTTVTKEEGRQGETRNEMRWVLLISTLLAVLVLGAFLFFNIGTNEENAPPAAEPQSAAPAGDASIETSIYLV